MGGKTHAPYPPEFKAEAIRLARTAEQPLSVTARNLGMSVETLRKWVKQEEVDVGEREGLTTDERVELGRLRRENRVLRMERDLLKKATAFFVRESEPTP